MWLAEREKPKFGCHWGYVFAIMKRLTKMDLLCMTNEQIKRMTLGKEINVVTVNGCIDFIVDKILTTPYASETEHSFVGFISTEGKTTHLQVIESIDIM